LNFGKFSPFRFHYTLAFARLCVEVLLKVSRGLGLGIIEVMNYVDPFDYGSDATLKKLVAITEYLNAKDQFMKNFEM
jgi:hypothetical protein